MIQRELSDPRIPAITSVTRVKVAEDLSVADVYVSMMASEGQQSAARGLWTCWKLLAAGS